LAQCLCNKLKSINRTKQLPLYSTVCSSICPYVCPSFCRICLFRHWGDHGLAGFASVWLCFPFHAKGIK